MQEHEQRRTIAQGLC